MQVIQYLFAHAANVLGRSVIDVICFGQDGHGVLDAPGQMTAFCVGQVDEGDFAGHSTGYVHGTGLTFQQDVAVGHSGHDALLPGCLGFLHPGSGGETVVHFVPLAGLLIETMHRIGVGYRLKAVRAQGKHLAKSGTFGLDFRALELVKLLTGHMRPETVVFLVHIGFLSFHCLRLQFTGFQGWFHSEAYRRLPSEALPAAGAPQHSHYLRAFRSEPDLRPA